MVQMDFGEPDTRVNERIHDWQHQYSIYVKHSTGQMDDDGERDRVGSMAATGETKVGIWRCGRCGQIWRHP